MGSVKTRLILSLKKRIVGRYVTAIIVRVVHETMGIAGETVFTINTKMPAIGAIKRIDIPTTVPINAIKEHRSCVNALRATIIHTSDRRP